MVGFTNRNVSNARIADEKPVWQIAFFVDDPNNRIEEWQAAVSRGTGAREMRKDQCSENN